MFEPTSIAVIGASTTEGKVGHEILKNLVKQGYRGELYPVNPKADEILSKKTYTTISDVPGDVELAVVVIPAKFVPAAVQECADKGVETAVIISAGFSEVHTDEGKALEDKVKAIAQKTGIKIVGPNCLGVLRPSISMNASFGKDLPAEGNVALISQSGAMAVAIMDASPALHIGYSLVASIGNKATMDECDFLEWCEQDEKTKVIGFYLESILDGQRFLEVASRVSKTKHIVLLKSGVSEHGKEAASSHTGALAGNDAAIDAACKQAGMHRARSAAELLDLVSTLSVQPPLLSPNVAVITNAGGPGILATDAAEKYGLKLPHFSDKVMESLKPKLPAAAGLVNPIDVIGDAETDRYVAALEACGDDPNIDGVCVLLTPQVMTPSKDIAKAIADWNRSFPLMPVVTSFMGAESVGGAREVLQEEQIPTFETPDRAMQALSSLLKQKDRASVMVSSSNHNEQRANKAATLLNGITGLVPEDTAKELFALYDLELPSQGVATSADDAVQIADDLGYPVIAKVSSPDILHKTDVGGVRANLQTAEEVRTAYQDILNNVKSCKLKDTESNQNNLQPSTFNQVLIQQFLPIGNEFIIGSLKDPSFGPLIMVGLGGIYTELFKDTSFRIAPVSQEESYEMLQELTAWKLLLGMRGQAQSDIDDLAAVVEKVSQMVSECPQITELDINPLLVGEDKIVIADVKVVLS